MLLFFVIPASLIFFSPPPESHANFFTSRLVFFLYGRHRKWQRMATLQPTAPYPTRFYRGEGNAPGGVGAAAWKKRRREESGYSFLRPSLGVFPRHCAVSLRHRKTRPMCNHSSFPSFSPTRPGIVCASSSQRTGAEKSEKKANKEKYI